MNRFAKEKKKKEEQKASSLLGVPLAVPLSGIGRRGKVARKKRDLVGLVKKKDGYRFLGAGSSEKGSASGLSRNSENSDLRSYLVTGSRRRESRGLCSRGKKAEIPR